jgi:HEAT repeat protein
MSWPVLLLLALPAQPTSVSELARVERTLREASLPVDGPGLLAYVKAQTPSLEDDARLQRLVRQLGDDDFDKREEASQELVKAGRKAVAYLKPAAASKDLEVARRAEKCLEAVVDSPLANLMPGVVRLLVERKPDDALPILLAYLPASGDETVEDAIIDALRVLGVREGKADPALGTALKDTSPVRRAAAALALGDTGDRAEARRLTPLLNDPEPRVRFEAAQALARCGDLAGVPALLGLIETAPRELAWQAEEVLARLAGADGTAIPGLGPAEPADRLASLTGWRAWWTRARAPGGWTPRPLEPYLNRTLVVEFDGNAAGGAIYVLGRDGKKRWQLDGLAGPNDVQLLPGGRLLVAERAADRVTEYDRTGKIVWSQRTGSSPVACQRLASGATLIATFSELALYTPEGKKTMVYPCPQEQLRHARSLPDGTIVAITGTGTVLELNAEGKELRKMTPPSQYASGAGYWATVERVAEGRYLTSLGNANKVLDLDAQGKILRDFNVPTPVSAVRLRNGHTLVTSFDSRFVLELDRDGKEVWRIGTRGRPFYAVRY